MRFCRTGIASTIALTFATISAFGQEVSQPTASPPAPSPVQPAAKAKLDNRLREEPPLPEMTPEMEKVLLAWEAKSRSMESLDATFQREDDFRRTTGEMTTYQGRVLLQAPNLSFVGFGEKRDDATFDELAERIVCTDDKIFQYEGATKQILVWPLEKDERKKAIKSGDLRGWFVRQLLDAGPPFLFLQMNAADVKGRYAMRLVDVPESAPKNVTRIEITPRLEIDRDVFRLAHVDLDQSTFLPVKIRLLLPNGLDRQTYSFRDGIAVNPTIDPARFTLQKAEGWKVINN